MLKTVTATSLALLASSLVGAIGTPTPGVAETPRLESGPSSKMTTSPTTEQARIKGVELPPQWDEATSRFIEESGLGAVDADAMRAKLQRLRNGAPGKALAPLPAIVVPKKPIHRIDLELDENGDPLGTGRITLKFRDGLGVRASLAGTTPAVSVQGADVAGFNGILAAEGATVRQLIHMTEAELEGLRQKAFDRSNRIQPDLAAMLVVEFDGDAPDWDQVLRTAQAINAIDDVEWVSVEPQYVLHQEQNCGTNMVTPCNRPTPFAVSGSADCWDDAVDAAATFPGVDCNPDPGCEADPERCTVGCMDAACCATIAGFSTYCGNTDEGQGWDVYCAALANAYCAGTVYDPFNPTLGDPDRYDPCLSNYYPALADGGDLNFTNDPALAIRLPLWEQVAGLVLYTCYEEHPQPACSKPACCATICEIDFFCCTETWDAGCVDLANDPDIEACIPDQEEGTTPDSIAGGQAYLLGGFYNHTAADPDDPATWFSYTGGALAEDPANPYLGFTGPGLDIDGLHRTIGIIWRLYGSGAATPSLPNPDIVWLDGEEFQVVPAAEACDDAIAINPAAPRSIENPFPEFGVDPGFNYNSIRLCPTGRVQNVAVCEFSAFTMHEEFTRVLVDPADPAQGYVDLPPDQYRAIPEAGQTQNFLNASYSNHGLACLGVTVAPDNGFGVRGIAPRAQGFFYPIESIEEGARAATAFAKMAVELEPGSIVTHSWGPVGPPGEEGEGLSLASIPEFYTLIRVSTDAGLVVCNSAGNNCAPMAAEAGEIPSGLIVVGASYPGFDLGFQSTGDLCFDRRAAFSNFSGAQLIPVYAWGVAGTTTGTGGVFRGLEQRSGINFVEAQFTRSYQGPNPDDAQGGFNGTSFACPQIAGGLALIQGVARMFWDQPLNGDLMLVAMPGVLYDPFQGIISVDDTNCGTFGYAPDDNCRPTPRSCYGDIFAVGDPDCPGVATSIGTRLNLPAMAAATLTTISDTTNDSLVIHTGTRVRGGAISITGLDNAFLEIRSELSSQGPAPDGLVYLGTGQTIDFGTTLDTPLTPETYEDGQLLIRSRKSAGAVIVEVPFARNRLTNRWTALGVRVLDNNWTEVAYPLDFYGNAADHFNAADQVDVRIYCLALGFVSTGTVTCYWDLVEIDQADPFEPL